MPDKARVLGSPFPDFFPMRRMDTVTHAIHEADALINLCLQDVQKGHGFPLTRPFVTLPLNLA
jgi:hypothetical protein